MTASNLDAADLDGVAYGGLINEDVMQKIWDISKIPLPFTELIGTGEAASNQYTEWTKDALQAVDTTNAVVDGADISQNDTNTGDRVGNHCQISVKEVQVSSRANRVDSVGGAGKLSYQLMMRQQELRRDVEAIASGQQASVAATSSVAGKSAGFEAWLETNTDRGGTGADGGFNTGTGITAAPTIGNKRALTETGVRDLCENIYNGGGNPSVAMGLPKVIRIFSEYLFTSSARIATLQSDTGQAAEAVTAKGSVNVFVTDFGVTLELRANRLQQSYTAADTGTASSLYLIDPSRVELCFLNGYQVEPLSKTGLSEKRLMSVDWSLRVLNEDAHGVFADINHAAAAAYS